MKTTINATNYSFREKLILFFFDALKGIYKKFFKRNKKAWKTTILELLKFEDHTLGKDLALFIQKNNFQLEAKYENHDVYHVLTNYPTTIIGEICLATFNVGNGKKKLFTVASALIGAIIMFEHFKIFKAAYQRGKNAKFYGNWKFEYLLKENTEELKKYIFKQENTLSFII